MWIRHLLAVASLPFVVTVLVPYWIARRNGTTAAPAGTPAEVGLQAVGVLLVLAGLVFFLGSLLRFVQDGRGTLAPWDPPRRLVVGGLYAHVRNPMISGVVTILLGEALALLSIPHLAWAGAFAGLNLLLIPAFEEPRLRRRFGREYDEYRRHVPRVIPRLRPWKGGTG